MATTRRNFLAWLGIGAVTGPAAVEALGAQSLKVEAVQDGVITAVNVLSAGSGYTATPTITFSGGGRLVVAGDYGAQLAAVTRGAFNSSRSDLSDLGEPYLSEAERQIAARKHGPALDF